nr:response regulator [Bradyrhizobium guangdongense]
MPEYKSVYVVDDDPSMRRSMKRLLREHGYETVLFDSAGALIRHGRFEWALCIVLDIDLNGSSGIDLRRQLVTQGIAVPIIFVTGNDSEACRSAAVESGCAAYLNKPFMPQSFIASIQAVCGRAN